jgi:glycosyltransferase involved in cell wall biosynthesis
MTHICICICTYKREARLAHLLAILQNQKTDGLFTYSILVVDNDRDESAKQTIRTCSATSGVGIDYCVEPEQNIALARNRAVQNAHGDFVAFIDDDELPVDAWLLELYRAFLKYQPSAVLGPVKPQFETRPPAWVVRGGLFERPSYPTGTVLAWHNTRTGNVLLKRSVCSVEGHLFRKEFRHSEDQDFFKRITERGHVVIWCEEGVVYEVQYPDRFTVGYFLRRALLRGNVSLRLRSNKAATVGKSVAAFLIYTGMLPVLCLCGRTWFIKYLIKDCDHIGRLLAACRIDIQRHLA